MPRVILSSPDQKALLRLEPEPDGQWWTLHHAATQGRPAWYASFGARTPVETIAGFIDALTGPTALSAAEADPYEPLLRAGWTPDQGASTLRSPDTTASVQQLTGEGPWFVTVMLGESRPVWQARFGEHTPPHLITAFTAALADPSPVARTDPLSLPTRNPDLVTRTDRDVPAAQFASALENRVRTLAARCAAPPATPRTPRHPPTNPGRAR
ncbi:DUF317 domain-containing protein [Streptomyces sp. NPDC006678]|uniref:DUF317 domain-containing protein n=1 Tax=Streptomyces sp. NPDC006678 TaxID=3157185 RepID=UPI0034095346